MFVSIGDALIMEKNGERSVSGFALKVARKMAETGMSSSFLGGVSSDSFGEEILNYLIDSLLLFDPVFCGSAFPTMRIREEKNKSYFFEPSDVLNSSVFDISFSKLKEAFSQNTDIDTVFFGGCSLFKEQCAEEIIAFLETQKNVKKIFSLGCNSFFKDLLYKALKEQNKGISFYVKKLEPCFEISDLIVLSENDRAFFEDAGAGFYSNYLSKCIFSKTEEVEKCIARAYSDSFR